MRETELSVDGLEGRKVFGRNALVQCGVSKLRPNNHHDWIRCRLLNDAGRSARAVLLLDTSTLRKRHLGRRFVNVVRCYCLGWFSQSNQH
jgi:hypothetical protein